MGINAKWSAASELTDLRDALAELQGSLSLAQLIALMTIAIEPGISVPYAQSLVAATPDHLLVEGRKDKPKSLTADQIALMQRESESLDREVRAIERTYGEEHLDLVVALGYVSNLLGNVRVVRFLAQRHATILAEFQRVVEFHQAA